jgi:hypothetical protein
MTMWIVRALAAGVLLSLAALAAERVAGWMGVARRWVWAAAMAATLALPLVALWAPGALPSLPIHHGATAMGARITGWSPEEPRAAADSPTHAPPGSGRLPALAWAAASLAMLGALARARARLRRVRAGCTPAEVDGFHVLLSSGFGPAVLGFRRPAVVLPAWVLAAPAEERALIVRHEREHLASRDAWLLLASALAVAAMPWSAALWWQHRRLRLAVEIDCDTRVLAAGGSRRTYGAALLRAAGGAPPRSVLAPAWGERSSHLERRLIAMTIQRGSHRVLSSVLLGLGALCAGVAACDAAGAGTAAAPTLAARPAWDGATPEVVSVGSGPSKRFGLVYSYDMEGLLIGNGRRLPPRAPHHPVVSGLLAGSPAAASGLQVGDTILSANGRDGREKNLFPDRAPGARYELRVRRAGANREFSFAVGRPEDYPG